MSIKNKIIIPTFIGITLTIGSITNANIPLCDAECKTKASTYLEQGKNNLSSGNIYEAILDLEEYFKYNSDRIDLQYEEARKELAKAYEEYGNINFENEKYSLAEEFYKKALNYNSKSYSLNYNLGALYYVSKNYENAVKQFEFAYELTYNSENQKITKDAILKSRNMILFENSSKNAPTNDPQSVFQSYLNNLNIPNAWKKVQNNNEVVVAVIDDGIDVNHPDFEGKIWTSKNAKYGDNKIIDLSGETGENLGVPSGSHGTMVAGIIGANQNNRIGIAGIAKNVKIMPIKIFGKNGESSEDKVISAMHYAIDNGANIINLSLGASQFTYTSNFDEVIKKAYNKGIVVVNSAGNGNILQSGKSGINLDYNPVAPVCNNNGDTKYSIGVYSTDLTGNKSTWTNYGKCARFAAPGEKIISTSIPIYNANKENYEFASGTSLSAPIISGVIALGYNEYGFVHPDIVQESLIDSYITIHLKTGEKETILDAEKYIENLGIKTGKIAPTQSYRNRVVIRTITAEQTFKQIDKNLSNLPKSEKQLTYIKMLVQLNEVKSESTNGNTHELIDGLMVLIIRELSKSI